MGETRKLQKRLERGNFIIRNVRVANNVL